MSNKILYFSENIKAKKLISDIANLNININFDESQLALNIINQKYEEVIKYLLFYTKNTINLAKLAIALNNIRIAPIYDVIPDISHNLTSNNNVASWLLKSINTKININEELILTGDFSIYLANMNKTYRIKNNNNITNYLVFIYNLSNETISIVETDVNNITYDAFNTEEILSHKLVNLISLENSNTNIILIDGTSLEVIYNNLPKITIQNNTNNNIVKFIRNSHNVQLNYLENIFANNFSIRFNNLNKSYKVPINDTNINNLVIYVYNLYDETISFETYNTEHEDIFVTNSLVLNNFINLINNITDNYNLLVIDGMYLYNSTSGQPRIETIFNQFSLDLSGNNNDTNVLKECVLTTFAKL